MTIFNRTEPNKWLVNVYYCVTCNVIRHPIFRGSIWSSVTTYSHTYPFAMHTSFVPCKQNSRTNNAHNTAPVCPRYHLHFASLYHMLAVHIHPREYSCHTDDYTHIRFCIIYFAYFVSFFADTSPFQTFTFLDVLRYLNIQITTQQSLDHPVAD